MSCWQERAQNPRCPVHKDCVMYCKLVQSRPEREVAGGFANVLACFDTPKVIELLFGAAERKIRHQLQNCVIISTRSFSRTLTPVCRSMAYLWRNVPSIRKVIACRGLMNTWSRCLMPLLPSLPETDNGDFAQRIPQFSQAARGERSLWQIYTTQRIHAI